MSHFISTKVFAKISELDEAVGPYDSLSLTDEFVVVNDNVTKKITGLNLTESIVSIGNLASKAYVDAVVDGAPALLDTLNELAAALNNDENFATTITALIGTKLSTANFGLEFWSALEGVTTFNIAEDTNLYYTQARFDSAFAAKTTTALAEGDNLYWTQARFDEALGSKSTSDTSEGSNLYYTQARFDSALAAKTTADVAEGTNLYFTEQRVLDVINSLPPDPADRLINGDYIVALSTTGQLNLPSAANTESNNARIQSATSIDILSNLSKWTFGTDGYLTLPAGPVSDSHAATKGYVDSQVNYVVAGQGFATLDYVGDAISSVIDTARTEISTEINTAIDTAELDGGEF